MLSGLFKNCYGMKEFELKPIDFRQSNRAIIYAPNGVMKTSFSNVFYDISKGLPTTDRIFKENISSYRINYYSSTYSNTNLNETDRIYVVKSFDERFELSRETISTLLADETTRKKYDILVQEFKSYTDEFLADFNTFSGFPKAKIEDFLKEIFDLDEKSDWPDIFLKLNELNNDKSSVEELKTIKLTDVINEKTIEILKDEDFVEKLNDYLIALEKLIDDNELLSENFNDYNAEELGKNLKKHNLFESRHKIVLKDGTEITTLQEWNKEVDKQLNKIYSNDELGKKFKSIKIKLSKNEQTRALKKIIQENREIVKYLVNIDDLIDLFIVTYINNMSRDFNDYFTKVNSYTESIKKLYETAEQQAERWKNIVDEFNRRFKVPFEVKIENKANFLLKDEIPNLYFTYTRCEGQEDEEKADYGKDELMKALSMGEKRAMYLLYILFDIEIIKEKANNEAGKYLIIIDDIADSFDYKNKYAIIEYLYDISKNDNIDLLILTHNFDFYRTTVSRIGIINNNCYIVQKNDDEILEMKNFGYSKDYFSNVIVSKIKDGNINTDEKKKKLIASIPFYRNLSQYILLPQEDNKLTCLLHIKTTPLDTVNVNLSNIWDIISNVVNNMGSFDNSFDENYIDAINRIALSIYNSASDEVKLENKILLSIAIRLQTEIFLKSILTANNIDLNTSKNQTRDWSTKASSLLNDEQNRIVNEVNLMTPESIHLNSFMYEPIIDMSNWTLKKLYKDVLKLNGIEI
mgnify:CR=1 FL=1